MNEFLKTMTGMSGMTDQILATDFLISSKSGVINTAFALTESVTPELRGALREQLFAAIDSHEKISSYIISKGYYRPNEMKEQIQIDLTAAQDSLNLTQ
ncbi:spore coat protein [Jeotgalibacillus soli]|uniref:Spore coat protein GerQ n=1 Tax=Jeotgalibacillus soli TaxID=889306 RepID=A0A0C2S9I7_9BACL|nr:spore coat protein [Jeotgalibacillus soli]KIL50619.1 spore coat protein GerQ [Jeotgalibacillus soli]